MTNSSLKTVFVGSGNIMQSSHLPHSQNIDGLERTAIYGRNVEKLKKLAGQFSIARIYTDWDKLFDECAADISVIGLPPRFHFSVAQKALLKKCHVLLEKPGFLNVGEGETLADTARSVNRLVVVNMTLRFLPIINLMKDLAQECLQTTIINAHIDYHVMKPKKKWYFNSYLAKGGAALSIGIHAVDLLCYILNRKISNIEFLSTKRRLFSKIEDGASANVFFSEHEKCTCRVSWLGSGFSLRLELRNKKNLLELTIEESKRGRIFLNGNLHKEFIDVWEKTPQHNALANLVACIRNESINMSSITEHVPTLNALLNAYSNHRKN